MKNSLLKAWTDVWNPKGKDCAAHTLLPSEGVQVRAFCVMGIERSPLLLQGFLCMSRPAWILLFMAEEKRSLYYYSAGRRQGMKKLNKRGDGVSFGYPDTGLCALVEQWKGSAQKQRGCFSKRLEETQNAKSGFGGSANLLLHFMTSGSCLVCWKITVLVQLSASSWGMLPTWATASLLKAPSKSVDMR